MPSYASKSLFSDPAEKEATDYSHFTPHDKQKKRIPTQLINRITGNPLIVP